MKNLKNTLKQTKKLGVFILLGLAIVGCDSTADSITPTVTPASNDFIYIHSTNAFSGNQCNLWDLIKESPGPAMSIIRSDNFSPALLAQTTLTNQCSAYCRDLIQGSKRYVVSTGERVVVYETSYATPIQHVFMVNGVQAMEFVNGRFFMVKNDILKEYDIFSGSIVTAFTPITLTGTGNVSNMTFDGNDIYVIKGNNLIKISTVGSGSLTSTLPIASGAVRFEGLEYINSAGCPNSLYAIRRDGSLNEFVQINPVTGVDTLKYTLTTNTSAVKISAALDYTTEFYYLFTTDGYAGGNGYTYIDLTPASSTYVPSSYIGGGTDYNFGLQFKD